MSLSRMGGLAQSRLHRLLLCRAQCSTQSVIPTERRFLEIAPQERGSRPAQSSMWTRGPLTATPWLPMAGRHFSTCPIVRDSVSVIEAVNHTPEAGEAAGEAATSSATATSLDGQAELVLDFIPERPTPLAEGGTLAEGVEPSLESLGLASWWPPGRFQYLLELFHVNLDVPWWVAIVAVTVSLRILLFPMVVSARRAAIDLNNKMPGMVALQSELGEARKRGDMYETQRISMDLQKYMRKNEIKPWKSLTPMFLQAPIFISMFMGLRNMTTLPVESMETGGLLWITDLTVPDPYYVLPVVTAASVYLQLKVAADGLSNRNMGYWGKFFMSGFPFLILPLSVNMPAAITFYWATTNMFSILQAGVLRIPVIQKSLKFPEKRIQPASTASSNQKGFVANVRESLDNFKVQSEVADRRQVDEQTFKEAGVKKPRRTYRFDPTRPSLPNK
ncbi:hypothetical protein TCAL_01760 [Tigriopus californicus]|uniref:Membrane insertase YidC/Oxa/ALB C-terminal domain-containing protein n=1 Tax=Tigriopus californicus TaxID=6832 RepID=A0A553N9J6_TIGCA|nr:mitochondrial inner membrane protein OXA1L-like [Tigriopus californicus]TRY62097.1 hypothetical protein TCAL_01760 [Tigriopus californicus]